MTAAITLLWLVLVVPFAAALAALPPNGDTAWLLYVARAMNGGQVLGRDVLEINLPLILWLKQPVMLAADRAGLPAGAVFVAAVALAILGATVCIERLLRHAAPPWDPRVRLLACAWILFVTTFEGGIALGQREHLAAVAVLPYLVAVGLRWQGAVLPLPLAVIVGAAAGIGFGLKPFFVPTFVVAELALARRRGDARAVLRAEAVACALVLAAYAVAIPLATPGWLASARVYWPLYDRVAPLELDQFLSWHAGRLALAALAVAAIWQLRRRASDVPSAGLLTGIVGFSLAFALQRKGWSYLTLPVGVLSLVTLGLVALRTPAAATARGRWARAALGALLFSVAAGYVAWEVGRVRVLVDYYSNPARPHGAMLRYFGAHGTPRSLTVLSSGHGMAFPLTLEIGARWGLRTPSLWPILTQYDLREAARRGALPIAAPRDAAHGVDSLLLATVAQDLDRCPTELLVVPEPRDTLVPNAATHAFDYLRYFGTDARAARRLAAYREVARVPDYVILARTGPPTACDAAAPPSSR